MNNKETKRIDLYCRRCRKSLHVAYELTGNPDSPVLPNITMKCSCCTRTMVFKKYTESHLAGHTKSGKYYV